MVVPEASIPQPSETPQNEQTESTASRESASVPVKLWRLLARIVGVKSEDENSTNQPINE